jgi:hydrogenase-4 component F
MLHTLCHSLTKSLLFLLTSNFLKAYKTIDSHAIRGAVRKIPLASWLLVAGILSLLGSPPFGTFISEFIMIRQMVSDGKWIVLITFSLFLTIIFYAIAKTVISMTFSEQKEVSKESTNENFAALIPQGIFIIILIILGIHIPEYLDILFDNAVMLLTGK